MNKLSMSNFALVDRNFRKMLRKILILTLDRPVQKKKKKHSNELETSLPLHEVLPSHLHLVAVMNERTQSERENFGKLEMNQVLSEETLDCVI